MRRPVAHHSGGAPFLFVSGERRRWA